MLLLYKDIQAGFMASCSGFSGTKYGSAHSLTMARGFFGQWRDSGTKGSILIPSWLKNSLKNSVTVYPHLPRKPQQAEGNLSCFTALSPYLHHSVIDRDEIREQVQVAGCEDEGKKYLALPRDSCVAGR